MESYTPAQAAAVTGLPLAAVHKAIDSRLIRIRAPHSRGAARRLLTKEQLVFLQLEAEGLRLLPIGARREIAETLRQTPKTDLLPVGNGNALVVQCKGARKKVETQLKQLAHIEEMVVSDQGNYARDPRFQGHSSSRGLGGRYAQPRRDRRRDSRGLPVAQQRNDLYRADVHACLPPPRAAEPQAMAAKNVP